MQTFSSLVDAILRVERGFGKYGRFVEQMNESKRREIDGSMEMA